MIKLISWLVFHNVQNVGNEFDAVTVMALKQINNVQLSDAIWYNFVYLIQTITLQIYDLLLLMCFVKFSGILSENKIIF